MVIHSVTPLHLLLGGQQTRPARIKEIPGGYLEGVETPQGFCLSRLYSTDPAMFLKNEYAPGSIYPGTPGK